MALHNDPTNRSTSYRNLFSTRAIVGGSASRAVSLSRSRWIVNCNERTSAGLTRVFVTRNKLSGSSIARIANTMNCQQAAPNRGTSGGSRGPPLLAPLAAVPSSFLKAKCRRRKRSSGEERRKTLPLSDNGERLKSRGGSRRGTVQSSFT